MSHQPLNYLQDAHRIAYTNNIPWYVTIELGLQCNLECSHCYNFDRQNPKPEYFSDYLSPARILTLIEELKTAGTLMIALSGGEPVLNKNIFSYIEKIRNENLISKLKSNGSLIDINLAKKLKKSGLMEADISVYGSNPEEHNWITNIDSAFNNTIDGIKFLRDEGIKTHLNFLIHKKNFKNISGMIKLADELNCPYSFSTEFTKRYDNTSLYNIGLDIDDYIDLLKSEHGDMFKYQNDEKALQCECARTVCGISSKGDLYPCIGAPIPSGNLKNQSFMEIWNSSKELNKIRNLKSEDFKSCSDCELLTKCSRSSGSAYVNTGNYTGLNPENCLEAKARNSLGF